MAGTNVITNALKPLGLIRRAGNGGNAGRGGERRRAAAAAAHGNPAGIE